MATVCKLHASAMAATRALQAAHVPSKRCVHPAFATLAAFAPLAGSRKAMALLDQGLTVLTGYY